MKNSSIINRLLTKILLVSLFALNSCRHGDIQPAVIDPSLQPTEFTEALKIKGTVKKGAMPEGKNIATFRIEKFQTSASVTNDNSLFIPFVYTILPSQKLKGFYLQIKGSNVYWDIPYIPATKSARENAANENPEKNGFVLDIGIPNHILNGKFELLYQMYDEKGNVSEAKNMKGEIVPSVDYCTTDAVGQGRVSGNDGITVRSYNFGEKAGWLKIKYNTFSVPDRIDIRQGSAWVLSTGTLLSRTQTVPIGQCSNVNATQGFVGRASEFNFYYDPSKGKNIDIYVSGCLDGGTQWWFEVESCPEEKAILGIHSSEPPNDCKNDCKGWGHAWISLTENGKTNYYGLWPDWHSTVKQLGLSNGAGSDVRTNIENGSGAVNRYYVISKDEVKRFNNLVSQNLEYSIFTYNCSSFAANVAFQTVGERLSNSGTAFIPMPCGLSTSMNNANINTPTGISSPITVQFTSFSRSFCENQ